MARKVLIGTITLDRDTEITNTQFSYAAYFERLLVPKGEYPIYAYGDDLKTRNDGKTYLGWRNYVGFEGTVIDGNVGGKAGDHTSYHQMWYDYDLAQAFIDGHDYINHGMTRAEYTLRPEWDIALHDFEYDGKRQFSLDVVLKDGAERAYAD